MSRFSNQLNQTHLQNSLNVMCIIIHKQHTHKVFRNILNLIYTVTKIIYSFIYSLCSVGGSKSTTILFFVVVAILKHALL